MKKRMFITTIVMMLVLAVALTTSSLAWFSSANQSVTASSATFYASTANGSNINLKISDSTGSWGNSISLVDENIAAQRKMVGVIPTAPLIAQADNNFTPTFTGVMLDPKDPESHQDVYHNGYIWPARMTFNEAKINTESQFVIDEANPVKTYSGLSGRNEAYFYRDFYIHNADSQNTINSLTFNVVASLRNLNAGDSAIGNANEGDYTCNAFAAFIIYDAVNVAVGGTVLGNALENAGKEVVATSTGMNTQTQVAANVTVGETKYYESWIPFAAFTFAVDNSGTNTETAWQYADLSNTASLTSITTLPRQQYDALATNQVSTGFKLNNENLSGLNAKTTGSATTGLYNGVDSIASGLSGSEFVMYPYEIFRVNLYYWLDGYTMTGYTDTTVGSISVEIKASLEQ